MNEASITINGTRLTYAQLITVRMALDSFLNDLQQKGLGEDKLGKEILQFYTDRISEVLELIHE